MKIIKAIRTCYAAPSQWNLYTDDGKILYARYRWGFISIQDTTFKESLFEKSYGDQYSGIMSFEELKTLTTGIFHFECQEEQSND